MASNFHLLLLFLGCMGYTPPNPCTRLLCHLGKIDMLLRQFHLQIGQARTVDNLQMKYVCQRLSHYQVNIDLRYNARIGNYQQTVQIAPDHKFYKRWRNYLHVLSYIYLLRIWYTILCLNQNIDQWHSYYTHPSRFYHHF